MAAPSKPWTDIPPTKYDADSPVTEELKTFENDNIVHTDERIGVPVAPANRQKNHRHRGLGDDGSDFIELTPQENLVKGSDGLSGWVGTELGAGGVGKICFALGFRHKIARSNAEQNLKAVHKVFVAFNEIKKKIKSSGGQGRFTCSMHMKRVAAASGVVGGTLRFGIWDGTSFVTGAFVDIDFDDVTQEYKRFYFISNQITRPATLVLRSEWVAEPSGWDIIANGDVVGHHGGYMVTNGGGIAKWDISHLDGGGDNYDADASNLFYWWDEIIALSEQSV